MHPIRDIAPEELDAAPARAEALRALNNAHATELSWLEPDRLRSLVAAAFMAARVGEADAFLLAFDQDAPYDSPNFRWFQARFDRFVYVDRVVVAPQARGLGLARRLYDALGQRTRAAGLPRLTCEVNAVPPNPASDALHRSLGFETVGEGRLPGGKTVRYMSREVPALAESRP